MDNAFHARRNFLKACAVLGLGVAAGAPLAFPSPARAQGKNETTGTKLLMGTFVTMTVVHESSALAHEAMGRAFEEMERLTALLSRHDPDTPMSLLNRAGRLTDAPPEITGLVERAARYHSLSSGAYDPTVGPLVDLFRGHARRGKALDLADGEVRRALELVDMGAVTVSGRRIGLEKSGMSLTLDGMAKGYIVDRASDVLSSCGATRHLINAGGDIRVRGGKAGGRPWSIAVQDPEKQGRYPAVIALRDGAVATSGSYEIRYDRDGTRHHLVDPATGASPHAAVSVSIAAATVMDADALSTAVFVAGPVRGRTLVDSLPGHECLIIGEGGARFASRGWNSLS